MRALQHVTAMLFLPVAIVLTTMSPAAAHTGFDSSDPAHGATVGEPVHQITLVFTGEAQPSGSGFQILAPGGEVREPTSATTPDGATWALQFDPPLAGGLVGVRWSVKAPDAHPIEGSFSFTVAAEAPDPLDPLSASPSDPSPTAPASAARSDSPTTENLATFLAVDSESAVAGRAGAAGRAMTLSGTLIGIGALVFAAVVLRGDHRDVLHVLFWVRRAGVLVILGAATELLAQVTVEGGGEWSAVWSPSAVRAVLASSFGVAVGLRLIGGAVMARGARLDIARAADVADPVLAIKSLVGVGAGPRPTAPQPRTPADPTGTGPRAGEPFVHVGDHAWRPTVDSAGAGVGAATLVVAHLFDGHTVSVGHRGWTAIATAVHVTAGAIWAGGLMMLVTILWRRHRQGRESRALQLALRFSVIATLALAAVGIAGVGLSVAVLDKPSELWETEWGRTLVAKTLFVGAAASAGAFNHKVLAPRLMKSPDDPELHRHFRAIVSVEVAALGAVVLATALLMGAAS